ncbi:MAG: ATP-binding protein [Chloroflexota bacterium]
MAVRSAERSNDRPDLPVGTVTFLFTDVEGSTRLVQALGADYAPVLAAQRAAIAVAVRDEGGQVFGTEGDAVFAVFPEASSAIRAGIAAQRALGAASPTSSGPVRVRMGIHTGEAQLTGDDYLGLSLHQAARISAAGHGGQVLVSAATRALVADNLPTDAVLRDLGEHRLKDLARPERLYQLEAPGLSVTFPSLRTLEARPNNLPIQLTTFIGRDELATARRLLGEHRLLTLTGPGGTGKTRLALQLAADAMDDFPDGTFFVPLDAVADPKLVPAAIAASLGVEVGTAEPLDRIIDRLASSRSLLVLDNFEQVIGAAASVSRLLQETTAIRVVVTSRIVLRIRGEQEFAVPPLGVPRPGAVSLDEAGRSEAVRLFVERAMAVDPNFRLANDDAAIAAEIVRRLDGLPLAIELAAARVRALPLASLRDRLDRSLSTLTGGGRDVPDRQRTLRGAIDWSYDLLDEPGRRLVARFGAFAGGAFLPEAEAVCGPAEELGRDVLDGLSELAEQSLVRPMPGAGSEPRFAMLATIREYAEEKLAADAESAEIRDRHAATYAALVDHAADELTGPDAKTWLDRLELDHDNIRLAIDRAIGRDDAETASLLVSRIWRFWQMRGHLIEAAARIERVLAMPGAAALSIERRIALERAGGSISYWRWDFVTANHHYARALELARASGDRAAIAGALYDFGFASVPKVVNDEERGRLGRASWEESQQIYRELGDEAGEAGAIWALTMAEGLDGDVELGKSRAKQALDIYTRLGDSFGIGWSQHMVGLTELIAGNLPEAESAFLAALDVFEPRRDLSGIILVVTDLTVLADRRDQAQRRWRLAGAFQKLRREMGSQLVSLWGPWSGWGVPDEPPADDPEAQASWAAGEELSLDELLVEARNVR